MTTTDWTEATRNWKPPGEIAGQGPRQVRLAAGGIALTVLSLMMFFGAAPIYWVMSRQSARQTAERVALDSGGIETQAIVTRHWRTSGKTSSNMIAYEFQYGGQVYHGESSPPRDIWRSLEVGSALPVRFVPGDPEVNHPTAWSRGRMPRYLPVVIAIVFAVSGFLPWFVTRRQTMLLRDGRAAPAIITGHRRTKQGYAAVYEYRLPDGAVRRGSGGERRTPPEVGSVIPVLFDPEHPRRNEPYPLGLVRLER